MANPIKTNDVKNTFSTKGVFSFARRKSIMERKKARAPRRANHAKEGEMEVYIEYAFCENFLFDFSLLALALLCAKESLRWWRIIFSACVGATFAVIFPLLKISPLLTTLLKLSVGFLLCLLVSGRLKTRKEWGRYALTTTFFFCFTFGFGGALLGAYSNFKESGALFLAEKPPKTFVWTGFLLLCVGAWSLSKKLYARKRLYQNVWECCIIAGERRKECRGFLDTGNLAMKNDLPVCFLSPDLFYELYADEILKKEGGQVCDEIELVTISGNKKVSLYEGEIEIEGRKKRVYYAPSPHMIGREYNVLLQGGILENRE